MKNLCSYISPHILKLHIVIREDYRNSIVDRFSMVFFVLMFILVKYQNVFLINIFLRNFLKVKVTFTFSLYNGYQGGRCLL